VGGGSVVEVMVMLMRAPGVGETLRNADCVPRLCLELDDSPHGTASHQLQHQRPDERDHHYPRNELKGQIASPS
jgi:hypothetical protein